MGWWPASRPSSKPLREPRSPDKVTERFDNRYFRIALGEDITQGEEHIRWNYK
jgi:hypothetical protein